MEEISLDRSSKRFEELQRARRDENYLADVKEIVYSRVNNMKDWKRYGK